MASQRNPELLDTAAVLLRMSREVVADTILIPQVNRDANNHRGPERELQPERDHGF